MSALNTLCFETDRPVPYRYHEPDSGTDLFLDLTCSGEVQWMVSDEKRFRDYGPRDESQIAAFEDRLKADVRLTLMRVLSDFSDRDVSYETLTGPNEELSGQVLQGLAPRWEAQGIRAETFRLTQAEPSRRDQEMIARLKKQAEFRDPAVLAAALLRAQQEAMKTAKAWKCPYCDSFNLDVEICPHCGAKKPE